jgi:membrane associated rhomboid family serine protease
VEWLQQAALALAHEKKAIPDSQIKTRTSPALSTYDFVHATFISELANFIVMAILGSTYSSRSFGSYFRLKAGLIGDYKALRALLIT